MSVMQTIHFGTSEVAILGRVLEPDQATLSPAAAEAILEFGFKQKDKDRMAELSVQAKKGTLSSAEQVEINNYEKVGHLLSLMKSKARRSLKSQRLARCRLTLGQQNAEIGS
jgi:hypothetical protein